MRKDILIIALMVFLFSPQAVKAQRLTDELKATIIQKIQIELKKSYIFEAVADKVISDLKQKYSSGAYREIKKEEDFAFAITKDMRAISKDLHLELVYSENSLESKEEDDKLWLSELLVNNGYGVKSKKILEGNIGYLQIPFFGPVENCADTLFGAMQFVAETDALIIDLRECRGSLDPDMLPLFSAYFFKEPVHLFDFENRETNTSRQMWSAAWVPGKKYLTKPLYILTSGRTFSGGEEFAYDLKHLKRAKIIGQVTKGGAHARFPVNINEHFYITIPKERSVNAITKTNWEQVGVKPTIEIDSKLALRKAHILALKSIIDSSTQAEKQKTLILLLQQLENEKQVFKKVKFHLSGFKNAREVSVAGSFNFWAPKNNFLTFNGSEWICELEISPGKHSYKFIVDGKWILDPDNPNTVKENEYVNSAIVVVE